MGRELDQKCPGFHWCRHAVERLLREVDEHFVGSVQRRRQDMVNLRQCIDNEADSSTGSREGNRIWGDGHVGRSMGHRFADYQRSAVILSARDVAKRLLFSFRTTELNVSSSGSTTR